MTEQENAKRLASLAAMRLIESLNGEAVQFCSRIDRVRSDAVRNAIGNDDPSADVFGLIADVERLAQVVDVFQDFLNDQIDDINSLRDYLIEKRRALTSGKEGSDE